jgi:choline monooxygenase
MATGEPVEEAVERTGARLDAGLTPTADWYTSSAIYELEREQVFSRVWQLVCPVTDVANPGDYQVVRLDERREFIVIRGDDGRLRAFHNVCPHRANMLLADCGHRSTIMCGYHGWTFNLDGTLRRAPQVDEMSTFERSEYGLYQVSVDEWGPFVFLNADPHAGSLLEYLGALPAELAKLGIDMTDIANQKNTRIVDAYLDCNWKIAVENSLECYHCSTSHPSFRATVDLPNWQLRLNENCIIQGTHLRPSTLTASDSHMDSYVAEVAFSDAGTDLAWFHWIFPNNSISVWPGPGNSFNVARWIPWGPNRTRWWSIRWWPADADPVAVEKQWEFICEVGWEDQKIVGDVQRGVESGVWTGGPFQTQHEALSEHGPQLLHQLLVKEMRG